MSIMASDAGAFKAATGLFASLDGEWHEVPLKPPPPPFTIMQKLRTASGAGSNGTLTVPTIEAGDYILVAAHSTNPLQIPTCTPAAGLTLNLLSRGAGIGLWGGFSPDNVPRDIGVTGSASCSTALVIRGLSVGGADGSTAEYASTSSPTFPVAAFPTDSGYVSVAAITHASYPTAPTIGLPDGWDGYTVANTGWNGGALAVKANATGSAVFSVAPAASGAYARATLT